MSRRYLVVGGTSGIGREIVASLAADGHEVTLTGRDAIAAQAIAEEIGPNVRGIAVDISEPEDIAPALADVGELDGLVLAAIERDANTVRDYDIARARRLVTLKLVGYTETVHTLLDRLVPQRSTGIVLFGGRAKDAPYPGRSRSRPSTAASRGSPRPSHSSSPRCASTRCTRASSATARSGPASPRASSRATRRARPAASSRR